MSFAQFTSQDNSVIKREYAELKELAKGRCANEKELAIVQKAFDFANGAHKNVRRRSGEPYILHPIAVAKIVIKDIGLGYKSITAALLHDVVEDTEYTTDDIRALFGDKIASLVDGLTKIKTVLDNEHKENTVMTESIQAENLKRILLTMNDDIRVVLIKLADRLHNCRTIEFMPEHKRDKILSETMYIFIPLAHRLGLYSIKSEMENIWLRYKEPDAYNDISRRISLNVEHRNDDIDSFIAPISMALERAGFDFKIIKRVKTPYSIWRKMLTKGVRFEEVYDLYAVRIVFNPDRASRETERDQCYHVFSIITGLYRYKPERMRDWVKQPKSNGYEALHCTLMSQAGFWVEVQIRTKRMDDIAEKGIAAHWAYKKEGFVDEADNEMDRWLEKVKDILDGREDISTLALLDIIHEDLTSTDIVVFTPKGDQKSIQNGASALDFAYQIHTEIGNKAIAAKVNMKLVPLSYRLKPGDIVEIITADSAEPQMEWFSFLRTRHAISAVMDHFRKNYDEYVAQGKALLTQILTSAGMQLKSSTLKRLMNGTQIPSAEEMMFRIALGAITMDNVRAILSDPQYSNSGKKEKSRLVKYILAPCCSPIPGDPIIGISNPDGTVTVHKKSCPTAEASLSKHGNKAVIPEWEQIGLTTNMTSFPVGITIKGLDRVGMLNGITTCISLTEGINMRSINLVTNHGVFEGHIEMYVHNRDILDSIITRLESLDGIQSVSRSELKS